MTKYQFLLSPLKYALWMDIYAYHLEHPKKSQWQVSLVFRVSKGTVCSPRVPIWTQSLTSL